MVGLTYPVLPGAVLPKLSVDGSVRFACSLPIVWSVVWEINGFYSCLVGRYTEGSTFSTKSQLWLAEIVSIIWLGKEIADGRG